MLLPRAIYQSKLLTRVVTTFHLIHLRVDKNLISIVIERTKLMEELLHEPDKNSRTVPRVDKKIKNAT